MLRLPPLYAIVDVRDAAGSEEAFALGKALLFAGIGVLQIRAKALGSGDLFVLCGRVASLCRRRGALFIVNDRLDVALAVGAGGVHLGSEDLPLRAARRVAPRLVIGATVRSAGGARRAIAAGASYVALGPMAKTTTKRVPGATRSLAELRAVVAVARGVPVVAVGGIDASIAQQLYRAGATSLAVCQALATAPDARLAARSFAATFRRARSSH